MGCFGIWGSGDEEEPTKEWRLSGWERVESWRLTKTCLEEEELMNPSDADGSQIAVLGWSVGVSNVEPIGDLGEDR